MTTPIQQFAQTNESRESDAPQANSSPFVVQKHFSQFHETDISGITDVAQETFRFLFENLVRNEATRYAAFLQSRIDYLSGLRGLRKNWISGQSDLPSQESIDIAKSLLRTFRSYVQTKIPPKLPKIVMGPIPTGGLTIEFHVDDNNALFVSIRNDQTHEIEVKYANVYFSYPTNNLKLTARLMDNYEAITEK